MSKTTLKIKNKRWQRRKLRIRGTLSGTAERPRLTIFRSLKNMYAELIDDVSGHTIVAASTAEKDLKTAAPQGGNKNAAIVVGKALAAKALAKGISEIAFDRNGYRYHGRVKALADAAREAGLKF